MGFRAGSMSCVAKLIAGAAASDMGRHGLPDLGARRLFVLHHAYVAVQYDQAGGASKANRGPQSPRQNAGTIAPAYPGRNWTSGDLSAGSRKR